MTSNEQRWIVYKNSQMKRKITNERKFTDEKRNSQIKNLTQVR